MNRSDVVLSGTVERTSKDLKFIKCRIKSIYKGHSIHPLGSQWIVIEIPDTSLSEETEETRRKRMSLRNGCFSEEPTLQWLQWLQEHDTRIFFLRRRKSSPVSSLSNTVELQTQAHVTKTLLSKLRILSLTSECTT